MKKNKKNTKTFYSRQRRSEADKKSARKREENQLRRVLDEAGISAENAKIRIRTENGFSALHGQSFFSGGKRRSIRAVGRYCGTSSGFGFVTPEGIDAGRDIFIPEGAALNALDGDLVEISYHKFFSSFGEEKTEGRVTKILEEKRKTVIGTVYTEVLRRGKAKIRRRFVKPDESRLHARFYINASGNFNDGDKVLAQIKRGRCAYFECTVINNFGESSGREANYLAILSECGIEFEFSHEELSCAKDAASAPVLEAGRKIRSEVIFTIDSETAKDLDDAVSIKRIKDGWQLGVHIADVSEYVKEKTPLDRLVMRRGTSVYFTDKVVPMLPEALSNGACSLNPGEPKYTLSAIINLSADGKIRELKLEPSIITSRVKGIYSEINEIFDGTADSSLKSKYKSCLPSLRNMHELYKILQKRSRERGALTLDSAEAYIELDADGNPCNIIRRERGDAEKMIEQFMLTANEAVATYLYDRKIPCVFRVHASPAEDKLISFIEYAHNLGFDTSYISREKATGRDFEHLLTEARERGISEAVSYTLLRSMAKAEYSDKNSSHFGLGIEKYCHFTSPIRRLSDLATHRIIHKALLEEREPKRYSSYAARAAAAATEAELRAVSAERRIENLYKTIYMQSRIGESFMGIISSVTAFGIFVTLENTCEGLIPISELQEDFIFEEKALSLRSRTRVFRIGDKIAVRLAEADITAGKLRFELEEDRG